MLLLESLDASEGDQRACKVKGFQVRVWTCETGAGSQASALRVRIQSTPASSTCWLARPWFLGQGRCTLVIIMPRNPCQQGCKFFQESAHGRGAPPQHGDTAVGRGGSERHQGDVAGILNKSCLGRAGFRGAGGEQQETGGKQPNVGHGKSECGRMRSRLARTAIRRPP